MRAMCGEWCRKDSGPARAAVAWMGLFCLAMGSESLRAAELSPSRSIATTGGAGNVNRLAFSRDSALLCWASQGATNMVTVWDIGRNERRIEFEVDKEVAGHAICFSPSGDSVLLPVQSGAGGRVDVHRLADGTVIGRHELPGPSAAPAGSTREARTTENAKVHGLLVIPDGSRLLVRRQHDLCILDGKTFAVVRTLRLEKGHYMGASDDGKFLTIAVLRARGRVLGLDLQVLSLDSLTKLHSYYLPASTACVTSSATGPWLLTWHECEWVLWRTGDGRPTAVVKGLHPAVFPFENGRLLSAEFTPDGQMFATAGAGNPAVRFWDARTGEQRLQLDHHGVKGVHLIAFSPNGKYMASATWETGSFMAVHLWDLTSRKEAPSYSPGGLGTP